MSESTDIIGILDAFALGHMVTKEVSTRVQGEYNKLQEYIVKWDNGGLDDLYRTLQLNEVAWCDKHFSADPNAKTAKGHYKLRTLLPKAYTSAKCVLLQGKALGVIDSSVGKTELQKRIAAHKAAPHVQIPAIQTITDLINAATHCFNVEKSNISDGELHGLKWQVGVFFHQLESEISVRGI